MTGPVRDRLLFLTVGSFSGANARLLAALRTELPDTQIAELDLRPGIRASVPVLARGAVEILRTCGPAGLRSRDAFRHHFLRSAAFAAAVRARVARRVAEGGFRATLQTQSLCNAGVPGVPNYVYTDHAALARDEEADAPAALPLSAAWRAAERSIYVAAAHVFTFGPRVREVLVERYGIPADRVTVAGAGVNVTARAAPDGSLARYARRNILFVGIEWTRKGGPELLEAFAAVRARFPDATLTVIGCDPVGTPPPGVSVLGRLPFEAVAAHFETASLFCLPSRIEPFGIAIAEALQFGLPVVSTTVGDIASMVTDGENGRLVAPRDPQALAAALIDMLESPERLQAFGARSAARAAPYTWPMVASRIAAHLRRPA